MHGYEPIRDEVRRFGFEVFLMRREITILFKNYQELDFFSVDFI